MILKPDQSAANLPDHRRDPGPRRQIVVERGKRQSLIAEGAGQIAEIAFVERLPVAAVDEGDQGLLG